MDLYRWHHLDKPVDDAYGFALVMLEINSSHVIRLVRKGRVGITPCWASLRKKLLSSIGGCLLFWSFPGFYRQLFGQIVLKFATSFLKVRYIIDDFHSTVSHLLRVRHWVALQVLPLVGVDFVCTVTLLRVQVSWTLMHFIGLDYGMHYFLLRSCKSGAENQT